MSIDVPNSLVVPENGTAAFSFKISAPFNVYEALSGQLLFSSDNSNYRVPVLVHIHHTSFYTEAPIVSIAISETGQYIVVGLDNKEVQTWDMGKASPALYITHELKTQITSVAIRRDEQYALSGSTTGQIDILDLKLDAYGDYEVYPIATIQSYISSVSIAEKFIAVGSWDSRVLIWDLITEEDNNPIKVLIAESHVVSVSLSGNGEYVAALSLGGKIQVWRVNTGDLVRTYTTDHYITSISFSGVGNRIASGSWKEIQIWDIEMESPLPIYTFKTENTVISVSFSTDGKRVASLSFGKIQIWDAERGAPNPIHVLNADPGDIAVSLSGDGKYVASRSLYKKVDYWYVE